MRSHYLKEKIVLRAAMSHPNFFVGGPSSCRIISEKILIKIEILIKSIINLVIFHLCINIINNWLCLYVCVRYKKSYGY